MGLKANEVTGLVSKTLEEFMRDASKPASNLVLKVEAILSVPLGAFDGVTYGHFGVLAGMAFARLMGVESGAGFEFFKYLIGMSAALGVGFFAINNVSREFRSYTSPTVPRKYRDHHIFRTAIRIFAVIVAVVSAVPFAGMAMTAGNSFPLAAYWTLVVGNTIARVLMNDYALYNLLSKLFDMWVVLQTPTKRMKLLQIENNYREESGLGEKSHDYGNLIKILGIIGFVAGAYTATYLYGFAEHAVDQLGIHSKLAEKILGCAAVFPTAALWGDDACTCFMYITKKIINKFTGEYKEFQIPTAHPFMRDTLQVVALILLAGAGAYSESRMAYEFAATASGFYPMLLKIFVPIAFIGIYGVSTSELVKKAFMYKDTFSGTDEIKGKVALFKKHEREIAFVKELAPEHISCANPSKV